MFSIGVLPGHLCWYLEGRNQSISILVPDSGLPGLGPVGACSSYLFKVGTPGQGEGIGWEAAFRPQQKSKKLYCTTQSLTSWELWGYFPDQ